MHGSAAAMHLPRYLFWQERARYSVLLQHNFVLTKNWWDVHGAARYPTTLSLHLALAVVLCANRGHGTALVEDRLTATVCGVVQRINKLIYVQPVKSRWAVLTLWPGQARSVPCDMLWRSLLCVIYALESGNAHISSSTQRLCRISIAMVDFCARLRLERNSDNYCMQSQQGSSH